MTGKVFQWVGLSGVSFFAFTLLLHSWWGPDIWYHLFLGRGIIETGSLHPGDNLLFSSEHFVNIYWLFEVICYGTYRALGLAGVTFLFMGVWVLAGIYWARAGKILRSPSLGLVLLLLAVLSCKPRFEFRPEVFSYLFLAIQLFILGKIDFQIGPTRKQIALYAGIEILWVNCHGYFVFGPLLAVLMALSFFTAVFLRNEAWNLDSKKRIGLLVAAAFIATLVSPLGIGTWEHLLIRSGEVVADTRFIIDEQHPPTGRFLEMIWTLWLFWAYWVFVAGMVIGFLFVRKSYREVFGVVLAVMGLAVSALSLRFVPFIVFCSAPLLAAFFSRFTNFSFSSRTDRIIACGVSLGSIVMGVWTIGGGMSRSIASSSEFGIGLSGSSYCSGFAQYLEKVPGYTGAILTSTSDASFLEYHFPKIKFAMDSRMVGKPGDLQRVTNGLTFPPEFPAIFQKFSFDGVLLKLSSGYKLVSVILNDPQFKLAYSDLHYAFFVYMSSPNAKRFPILPFNAYQGQDLTYAAHTAGAVTWALALEAQQKPGYLRDAARQLSKAKQVPSTLLVILLQYAKRNSDKAIAQIARELQGHYFLNNQKDEVVLNELWQDPLLVGLMVASK